MAAPATDVSHESSIGHLLTRLRASSKDDLSPGLAEDVGIAFAQILRNELPREETKSILVTLYETELEQHPKILARVSEQMNVAALRPRKADMLQAIKNRDIHIGGYNGGLCDIVGTGGDGWKTFNISTASSIIAAAYLLIAKHGNRASTSTSGSADVLSRITMNEGHPQLSAINPGNVATLFEHTNYGFLFAPEFHVGLKHVGPLRKEIPHPSIFNLLGPLANPAEDAIEACVIGVKHRNLVPIFAEALRLKGMNKAMVVCGYENLDEISCANPTQCARIVERPAKAKSTNGDTVNGQMTVEIEHFTLSPVDYGLPEHALGEVSPGKTPEENSAILRRLLTDSMLPHELPILDFVLMNVSALLVISGICDAHESPMGDDGPVITEVGPGGGRWKEGVRLARLAIKSGKAWEELRKFIIFSNDAPLTDVPRQT